jgi:ABC-type enterochelin transport system substrate-binding protein
LSEKHRIKMLENTVLRRMFGRKREEVTGEWRELNYEDLNDLKTSLVIKSRRRWAGHVARMEDRTGA